MAKQRGDASNTGRGGPVEYISTEEATVSRKTLTSGASAFVKISGATQHRHILLQAPSANPDTIIINFILAGSNDPTNAACGIEIAPGDKQIFNITKEIPLYARVRLDGGGTNYLVVAESL